MPDNPVPPDPVSATAIRITYRSLLQASDPLPRAAMIDAVADQTGASPEQVAAVLAAEDAP